MFVVPVIHGKSAENPPYTSTAVCCCTAQRLYRRKKYFSHSGILRKRHTRPVFFGTDARKSAHGSIFLGSKLPAAGRKTKHSINRSPFSLMTEQQPQQECGERRAHKPHMVVCRSSSQRKFKLEPPGEFFPHSSTRILESLFPTRRAAGPIFRISFPTGQLGALTKRVGDVVQIRPRAEPVPLCVGGGDYLPADRLSLASPKTLT